MIDSIAKHVNDAVEAVDAARVNTNKAKLAQDAHRKVTTFANH
jgi:hypothetical protein